jgi:hypothetical protein
MNWIALGALMDECVIFLTVKRLSCELILQDATVASFSSILLTLSVA